MMLRIAALLIMGALAGCAAATSPAPVVVGDAASNDPWALEPAQSRLTPAPAPVVAPQTIVTPKKIAGPGEVVVQSGDTLFAISRRHNTSLRSLIDANGLTPPYGVMAGQLLLIPVNKAHRVARGETLGGIAKRYGVARRSWCG